MNFLCSCCKSRITNDDRNRHLIEGAGIHNIGYDLAWMECAKEELSLPPDKRKWVHTDEVPVVGERRILKVTAPFDEQPGNTFTTVFEPWQMYLNGWDSAESPVDINKACAVLCRFDEVLCLDDFSAIISVTVLKTIPLDLLYKVIPETVTDDRFFEEFGGDEWNSGNGITDIYLPGADTVGLQSFKKVPYATVHFSASRMEASYGPDYAYTIASLCVPAKVVFDLP